MTLIGKVGSVSGSLTDGLACEECDRVAPAYCLGSPDQLAAHCSGHPPSPSRLSTLFSPKTRPLIFKLVLHATAFLSRFAAMWFVCYIHVFLFVFSTGGLFNEIFNSLNNLKLLSDTSKLSRDSYSHLTWEVWAHSEGASVSRRCRTDMIHPPLSHSSGTDRCALLLKGVVGYLLALHSELESVHGRRVQVSFTLKTRLKPCCKTPLRHHITN